MNIDGGFKWPVVPIRGPQLKDVRPEDLIGDFRMCHTYRGGGGYDQFPVIAKKRLGVAASLQFVVQLRGCPLRCPYCYVTEEGYLSTPTWHTSQSLYEWFLESGAEVFHLMGGAPALYYSHWPELLDVLGEEVIFHSDFILTESEYDVSSLREVSRPNCLYAVNIKGTNDTNYYRNTRRRPDWSLIFGNLESLMRSEVPFYITFTNPDDDLEEFEESLTVRFGPTVLDDSFVIDLIQYEALNEIGVDKVQLAYS